MLKIVCVKVGGILLDECDISTFLLITNCVGIFKKVDMETIGSVRCCLNPRRVMKVRPIVGQLIGPSPQAQRDIH